MNTVNYCVWSMGHVLISVVHISCLTATGTKGPNFLNHFWTAASEEPLLKRLPTNSLILWIRKRCLEWLWAKKTKTLLTSLWEIKKKTIFSIKGIVCWHFNSLKILKRKYRMKINLLSPKPTWSPAFCPYIRGC